MATAETASPTAVPMRRRAVDGIRRWNIFLLIIFLGKEIVKFLPHPHLLRWRNSFKRTHLFKYLSSDDDRNEEAETEVVVEVMLSSSNYSLPWFPEIHRAKPAAASLPSKSTNYPPMPSKSAKIQHTQNTSIPSQLSNFRKQGQEHKISAEMNRKRETCLCELSW